jgi:hypothetical protein
MFYTYLPLGIQFPTLIEEWLLFVCSYMVNNLLVAIVSERAANPVINVGSLY